MREISQERQVLSALREKAHLVLDTSDLSPRALKEALARFLGEEKGFTLRLLSFGFKWGPPQEADLVLDVRPLPNPHNDPLQKPKKGQEPEVRAYVFREEEEPFYRARLAVAGLSAEGARKEGRAFYTVAVGCTGGRHRSVAVAERLAEDLSGRFRVEVSHRDVEKEDEVHLLIDGHTNLLLTSGARVEFKKGKKRIKLIRDPRRGFFLALREKFGW
jgi:UPF0042 nucleotide-binding protein